ncbi:dna methylase-type I restriction-modification system [Treponema primitia ZAS-2]|uniref:Dna methylase-type I restriction-modification system n=1 Tax=Treponema primitia (strain ATCC BAA-887 / DSM 12427 / ZAS-2) TaxID=545694 RepID=F5YQD8_TREPZ|nr:restriction endonuclease subunit S [Treponema primitia]AEF84099.1 dna methylase-type I restriction-modification system [Treponema primitia ZAS-2]
MNSPFDKRKYKRLLEGLEASEVLISKCLQQNDFRLESSFWIQQNIVQLKTMKGMDIIDFVQYGTSKELNEEKEGYPILRLNEFNSRFIDIPNKYCKLISKDEYESLKLKQGDVLICRTNGNPNLVGRSALVLENTEYAYASYLFKIRPKTEIINSSTLVAFLSCKYGRNEIDKYSMTSNQTNFSPAKFKEIDIPIFNKSFNSKIEGLYFTAHKHLGKAVSFYHHAENLLLEAIGLKDFTPNNANVNVKTFKKSFGSTGRLDAEYYQEKYEDYEKLVKKYINGYEPLGVACEIKDNNFSPENEIEYQYIELADIGKSGNITGCTTAQGKDLPSRARRKVNANDVIVSTIEGSLSSCALVPHNYDDALCSTGFYVINSLKINSETLLVLIKSEPLQNLLKQGCSGTILTAISNTEFSNIPIPLIDASIQRQIADLINKSFVLRKESENLLEEAKAMVEREIEGLDSSEVKNG